MDFIIIVVCDIEEFASLNLFKPSLNIENETTVYESRYNNRITNTGSQNNYISINLYNDCKYADKTS